MARLNGGWVAVGALGLALMGGACRNSQNRQERGTERTQPVGTPTGRTQEERNIGGSGLQTEPNTGTYETGTPSQTGAGQGGSGMQQPEMDQTGIGGAGKAKLDAGMRDAGM